MDNAKRQRRAVCETQPKLCFATPSGDTRMRENIWKSDKFPQHFLVFEYISMNTTDKKGGFAMETSQAVTTERQIGKVTYIVVAAPSDEAREPLETKINKLLQKDIRSAESE